MHRDFVWRISNCTDYIYREIYSSLFSRKLTQINVRENRRGSQKWKRCIYKYVHTKETVNITLAYNVIRWKKKKLGIFTGKVYLLAELAEGVWFFISFSKFFSDNTRVRIFFFQNLTLGYMTKTLNQIFFFLHQNQNIFFSNIGNQNIFLEKKP